MNDFAIYGSALGNSSSKPTIKLHDNLKDAPAASCLSGNDPQAPGLNSISGSCEPPAQPGPFPVTFPEGALVGTEDASGTVGGGAVEAVRMAPEENSGQGSGIICPARPHATLTLPPSTDDFPTLSPEDTASFAKLKPSVQADVRLWLGRLAPFMGCSRGNKTERMQAAAVAQGIAWSTWRSKFYALKKSGWRGLVNRSKSGPDYWQSDERQCVPQALKDFYRELLAANQHCDKMAYRALLKHWRSGQPVPGYAVSPPPAPNSTVPAGWSFSNCQRWGLDKFTKAIIRVGSFAAGHLRPTVPATRVGMLPGECLEWDDHDFNVHVSFRGVVGRPLRPAGFFGRDVASGGWVADCVRAVVYDEVTGSKVKLKQEDFLYLQIGYLLDVGYRLDRGTTHIVESGTAAVPREFSEAVFHLTGGKVKYLSGFPMNTPPLPGLFATQGRGNYRRKAGLESDFGQIDDRLAHLPGQAGIHRWNCPEELYGRLHWTEKLTLAMTALPDEVARQLRIGVCWFPEFRDALNIAIDAMNRRIDHTLEGWERNRNVSHFYRLSAQSHDWIPADSIAAMPAEEQALLEAHLRTDPVRLWKTDWLSPHQVWERRDRQNFRRLPDEAVPAALGPAYGEVRAANDQYYFQIKDQEVDSDPLRYIAQIRGPHGKEFLKPRVDYLVHYCSFRPQKIWVSELPRSGDKSGAKFLGTCELETRAPRMDIAAVREKQAEIREMTETLLAPALKAARKLTERGLDDAAHNLEVLARAQTPARPAPVAPKISTAQVVDIGEPMHNQPTEVADW